MQTTTMTHEHYHPHAIEGHMPCHKHGGVNWSAIIGGAIAATVVSLLLLILGAGLGFAQVSPWYHTNVDAKDMTLMAIVWLIVMQWVSSGLGGYLTGRLRNRWHGHHSHEGFFKDTAHGFLAWALATLVVAMLVSGAASNAARTDAIANRDHAATYKHIDADADGDTDVTVAPNGKTDVKDPAAVERAREAAMHAALWTFVAMLIGALIASAAAALGGMHRDEYDLLEDKDLQPLPNQTR